MITVGMNYDVIEGQEAEFEKVFTKVLAVIQKMEGHRESHLYRDVSAPRTYLILSYWTDEDAFQAFINSEQFKSVAELGRSKILAGRPRHEVYGGASAFGASCPTGNH